MSSDLENFTRRHRPNGKAYPKLLVAGVSKTFGTSERASILALRDISLEVYENEFLILLGPSGCGKSTLLRMIAGLEQPTDGRILLDGAPVDRPGRDRGMIFQSYTSFPWLTVRRNVEYGMRLNRVAKSTRQKRANEFIDMVGLQSFSAAYPRQLSGGMKQRVAIARTLANSPDLLLMDEPFGALDPETRWQMHELMLDIMRQSRTTCVMVTHDVEEALFLADRIVFLGRNPGNVREIITLDFKRGREGWSKEDLVASSEFVACGKQIMHMMREEGRKSTDTSHPVLL